MSNRREFLKTFSSAVLAPVILGQARSTAESKSSRIPIAFSTLGCSAWEWKKILGLDGQHGFSAIELRGLEGNLDLPSHPIFAVDRIEQTKKEIRGARSERAALCRSFPPRASP